MCDTWNAALAAEIRLSAPVHSPSFAFKVCTNYMGLSILVGRHSTVCLRTVYGAWHGKPHATARTQCDAAATSRNHFILVVQR